MTGFGQGSAESPQLRVSVELRGVNNRHTDLRFRMPPELADGEAEMRRRILAKVQRGRVEVTIKLERPDGSETRQTVNSPLLEEVLGAARTIAKEFGLKGEPDLMGVLSLPGMFRTRSPGARNSNSFCFKRWRPRSTLSTQTAPARAGPWGPN
jgi:uncharacterized protein (TIGR00255 family)